MKIDKDIKEKIQSLQLLEQKIQNFLMQKQAFQNELNEAESALEELKKSSEEVYKITGQIMIKSSKQEVEKELKERKDMLTIRIKSIETQENSLKEKAEEIKEELEEKFKKE